MSTTTMIIITATLSLASAKTFLACDEDAARALKRPWAPVVFHGERETSESLPEIDARFTPDGDADEAAGFRAVDAFNEMEPIPALAKAYVPGSPHRARSLARRAATDEPLRFAVFGNSFTIGSNCGDASGPANRTRRARSPSRSTAAATASRFLAWRASRRRLTSCARCAGPAATFSSKTPGGPTGRRA